MQVMIVTNLYPRPEDTCRGIFNAQLFRAMADRLSEDGGGVTVACLVSEWRPWKWRGIRRWKDPFTGDFSTQYVPVLHLPVIGRNISWRMHLAALEGVLPALPRPTHVLTTWLYPDAVAAARLAEREGLPFWIKVHGSDRFHLQRSARRQVILDACARSQGMISNCQFLAEQLAAEGIAANKIDVVRNGVDQSRFHPMNAERARNELRGRIDVSDRVVLYAGHLVPVKGPDRLLEAWKILCHRRRSGPPESSNPPINQSPDPLLVILGDGPMERRLRGMARSLGVSDSVRFVGSGPHEEMALWMNRADCLCLPSRSEGMPNVVLESLACGRPVVAADVGDVSRVVRENVNGAVVKDGVRFPERLAEALHRVLDREWDSERISAGTRELTWEHSARQLLNTMRRSLIAPHPGQNSCVPLDDASS